MKKRLLSMLLAVCMMIPALPVSAAESNVVLEPQKPEVVDAVYEYAEDGKGVVLVDTNVVLEEVVGADLPQIDAPTNAKWGDKTAGEMLHTPSVNGLGDYVFALYKEGDEKPIYTSQYSTSVTNDNKVREDQIDPEIVAKMETGRYYFTVYAKGDEEWADSEMAVSDYFDFVKPDKQLKTPYDVAWDGEDITYKLADNIGCMHYEIQFRTTEDMEWGSLGAGWYWRGGSEGKWPASTKWDLSYRFDRDGWYRFRVQIMSHDILEAQDSEWSEWSEGKYFEDFGRKINDELQNLLNEEADADTILNTLGNQDTGKLAAALDSDADMRDTFKQAEEKFAKEKGISVATDVANDMADKIKGDINILGAAFNTDNTSAKMALKVTKPTIEKEYDKQMLKNVVQVNMTLDGAENTEKLKVPVQISMPIPTGIKPEKLQILHYHNDGSYETIWPRVENGMVYFTLTSFSTFVFGNAVDSEEVSDIPFADVSMDSWMYEGIKYVYDNSIMKGVGDGTAFAPNDSLTRAMFATVLYRMAGEPAVTSANKFPDVVNGKWYTNAVIWANEKGIVSGYGDGTFGPDKNITREQMAKMMMEFAKGQGYGIADRADLGTYPDKAQVSGWASEYMSWAVGSGMIGGKTVDGKLSLVPKADASRAECATVLMRFAKKYAEK